MGGRKTKLIILGVLLAAGTAVYVGRNTLAERLYERALDKTAGIDKSIALGDGLQAYLCGSGAPLPDPDRAGPCIGIVAGRDAFVFDSGSGSTRNLLRMGFPVDRMQGVFLTHLHSDHIDGLGELLLQIWIGGSRGKPIPVYGPAGTQDVLAGLRQAYQLDENYRVAHHGPKFARPGGYGGEPRIIVAPVNPPFPDGSHKLDGTVAYEANGVKISAFHVDHFPIAPAYGYRIDYKGRSVTISGDTVYSPNLVRAAKDTDVLFHEALNPRMVRQLQAKLAQRGRTDTAKIMGDIENYHTSPQDAARAAANARAKALVLYHLVPSIPAGLMERLFVGDAARQFGGPLKVGRDGLLVSLPANGKAVTFKQVL